MPAADNARFKDYLARCRGQAVALLTRHGKETLLGPLLEDALGCRLVHVDSFDTDQLGSFTREIPRAGSQRDAARRKAELGMQLAGCTIGIASEGAFGADPHSGLLAWDTEIVLWLDAATGLEIVGFADGPAAAAQETVRDLTAMRDFARQAGFPAHHLVLRPDHAEAPPSAKSLADPTLLESAFFATLAASACGAVYAENDLRAHANPTRQTLIRQAGAHLLTLLKSACPNCATPGFRLSDLARGLPCEWCRQPTREVVAEIWSCNRCEHLERRLRSGPPSADASRCDRCNP